MSIFIDKKFLLSISNRLSQFKQKSADLYNFRCPFCGDSKKNTLKARGYIFRRKSDLFFTCHNCGFSTSFGNFLKTIDPILYKEYQMERFKNESSGNIKKPDFSLAKTKPVFTKSINLPSIESLSENHPARLFLSKRKIPSEKNKILFYAKDFSSFIDELMPNNDKNLPKTDERIVIPFYDEKNNLQGLQGRTISNSKVRYITITLNEESKKVYGLNAVDFSKKIYVVEGPLDSLFLQNSIAIMDATLYKAIPIVGNHDYVFVYDNESRNKDIIRHMKKTIEMGQNICVWPSHINEKDINDMVLAGQSPSEIQNIIDKNTFNGLRARLEFEQWKKI